MKRVILVLTAFLLLLVLPTAAFADSSDWTLVQIPGSGNDAFPVFFDTDTYLASDITTDINDNLYVMSGSRIIRFTPDGRLDVSWGNNGIIYDDFIRNSNTEQLVIAADSRGYVYALCRICEDGSPTFLKRYTPDGRADDSWYGDGVMGGKFCEYDEGTYTEYYIEDDETEPEGGLRYMDEIALDSKDNLYVLYDRQVYRFLPDGTPDKKWPKLKMKQPQYEYDEGGDGVWFDNALRIDWQDNIYLFNGYDQTVSEYNNNGKRIKKEKCGLYYPYDYYGETKYVIRQVAFDAGGNIYQSDYGKNTISKYSPEFKLISDWCGNGIMPARSYKNQQIYVYVSDTKGNIYILDRENEAVSKYTNEGKVDIEWGSKGSLGDVNGDGELMPHIENLVFDSYGSIYAVDKKENEKLIIRKYNSDLKLNEHWTEINVVEGWELGSNLATYDGVLYYEIQNSESKILRTDSEGKLDTDWYIYSSGPVHRIQTDKNGYLYLAHSSCIINRYTPEGKLDYDWGPEGILEDGSVTGMAIDNNGYVYTSIREFNKVSRYTPEGAHDKNWGNGGEIVIPDSGGYDEYYDISSIAVDDACNLYICDKTSNRILRYDSSGKPDTSWCDNGEWKSEDDISNSPMPMINPTKVTVYEGRLYAVWNYRLYVMSDSAAQVGTKPEEAPQTSATAAPSTTDPGTAVNPDNEKSFDWRWAIGAGVVIFCLGAVIITCIVLKKRRQGTDAKHRG